MLASKRELERTEGLKRVIAVRSGQELSSFRVPKLGPMLTINTRQMMTKNLPVTSFFPLVTSLLSPTTSLQSRSLISLYIVHCASHAPELALLSINAYQKDLSDPNPLVRAGAISTLAAMPLPDIRELVGLAVQKGARDTAWYVRRATADALRALYRADPHSADNRAGLEVTLRVLFDGATPLTVGAALSAWEELCPTKWDMVHPNYRRWCRMLMDVEEWGQTVLLRVLARYGRTFFLDPAQTGKVDPDAELALKSSEPLLQHLNPAVRRLPVMPASGPRLLTHLTGRHTGRLGRRQAALLPLTAQPARQDRSATAASAQRAARGRCRRARGLRPHRRGTTRACTLHVPLSRACFMR